jgi:hypothetical protein
VPPKGGGTVAAPGRASGARALFASVWESAGFAVLSLPESLPWGRG